MNNLQSPSEALASPGKGHAGFRTLPALIAGFTALLGIMVVLWVNTSNILKANDVRNARIETQFLHLGRVIDDLRADLNQASIVASDILLKKVSGSEQKASGAELESIREEMSRKLAASFNSLSPEQRQQFQVLNDALARYWSALEPLIDDQNQLDTTRKQNRELLNADAVSERIRALAIAQELDSVNEEDLREGRREIGEVSTQFQSRLRWINSVSLMLALILAAITILYMMRLEARARKRLEESIKTQRELRLLSARLVEVQEQERRSIARELHDEVGQSLGALLMDVEELTVVPQTDSSFLHRLRNIKALAGNCVAEVRNIALLLRPSMLDDLGLIPALEWQAREAARRMGLDIDLVEESVSDSLPEAYKICVYRIVQEALNNCSKHASARHVKVSLKQEPERLLLTVQDDGRGFDKNRSRGLGLLGIRERAAQLGGRVELDSSSKTGTCLRIDLPLAAPAAVSNGKQF